MVRGASRGSRAQAASGSGLSLNSSAWDSCWTSIPACALPAAGCGKSSSSSAKSWMKSSTIVEASAAVRR
ncbi:MAG: hypothetical protein QOG21_767 [Actinomycetota bacterium]|nr:hypothetical protein [Actinomycetota bacterium]